MRALILNLLLILLLLSCKQEYKRTSYYPSGKIEKEVIFSTKKDMNSLQNYLTTFYYENGNIKAKQIVRNGMLEGEIWKFHENGTICFFDMYKHNTSHGVYKEYDTTGRQTYEALYLNGNEVLFADISYPIDDIALYKYFTYAIHDNDTSIFQYSFLSYKKNGAIIEDKSHGCEVIGKDTIAKGQPYTIEIRMHHNQEKEDYKLKLHHAIFGDYCSDLKVDSSFTTVNAENNKIVYSFYPEQEGYNFIVGKVGFYWGSYPYFEDSFMAPIYKLFYVKEK